MSGWEKVPAALHLDTKITPAARALYPVLRYLVYRNGGRRHGEEDEVLDDTTEREIASTFGASREATRGYLTQLEQAGWIERQRTSRTACVAYIIHEVPVPTGGPESRPPVAQNLDHSPFSTDIADFPPTVGANTIVAGYVDAVRKHGVPAPRRTVGIVARNVKELLDEGVDPPVVERAVALMVERRLHPATLPTLVLEAAAGPRQPQAKPGAMRYGLGMTTRQMLDATKGRK